MAVPVGPLRRGMVEVEIVTSSGHSGRGAAPTGQSVGMYESFVLPDKNPVEYRGMSVHKAVANVNNTIAPALIGLDVSNQSAPDGVMIDLDGTPQKSRLGGNAIYSASIACLRAAASVAGQPVYRHIAPETLATVPVPSFNMINGGRNGQVHQASTNSS